MLVAGSLEQARITYRMARSTLEPTGAYKFADSATRIGIRHRGSNARLRVIGSSGRGAMGLGVDNPLIVGDEPGSWKTTDGELLADALLTAQGKPGQRMKAVLIGTLAPARRGWWHSMVQGGSKGSRHVTVLQGDPRKWDRWQEIRRVNPLCNIDAGFRHKLLEERDEARADSRLKARFLSYRLNLPTSDSSEVLLTAEDWELVRARELPPRQGQPLVGIDLGQGRSWSAAVAWWPNGRVEAVAVAPGIPDVDAQERRDRVPSGAYRKLVDLGVLATADGLRVPPVALLMEWIKQSWGIPAAMVADRFRLNELRDCGMPCPLLARVTRWSESSEDIRALQKAARDGPLACPTASDALILESLVHAEVRADDAGSVRLVKRDGANNTGRDDVCAALTLAAGAAARRPAVVDRPAFRVV